MFLLHDHQPTNGSFRRFHVAVSSAVSPVDHGVHFKNIGSLYFLPTAQRGSKVEKSCREVSTYNTKRRRNKYSNAIVISRPSSSFRLNVRQVPCIPTVKSVVVEHLTVMPLPDSLSFLSCLCLTRTLTRAFPRAARELESPHDHFCALIAASCCV